MSRLWWNGRYHPKRELWFAWWVMVVFYNMYGVLFFFVTHVQPPPRPAWDTPTVVRWFADNGYGVIAGFAIVFLVAGICAPMNALLAYSMRRMSVSRVFAYSYLIIYALAAVPGMLVMAMAMTVAAMRPDRDPEIIQWLYDFGFLSFSGTMGVFLIGSLVWMVAILLDKNRVFPKWFGYLEPLQRADGGGGRARVDLPARRVRVERRHRVVDQHGGVRDLHRRLHRAVPEDDRTRGLRHRPVTRPVRPKLRRRMTDLAGAACQRRATCRRARQVRARVSPTCGCSFSSRPLFTGYFSVYLISRTQNREAFLGSQADLDLRVGVFNTIVLLLSSWAIARCVQAARERALRARAQERLPDRRLRRGVPRLQDRWSGSPRSGWGTRSRATNSSRTTTF